MKQATFQVAVKEQQFVASLAKFLAGHVSKNVNEVARKLLLASLPSMLPP